MTKRIFDLLTVFLTSPLWVPLIVLVGGVIKFKLGSPVIFIQNRPGKNGVIFRMYKFRSMTNARDASGSLLSDEERLTAFGKLLRSTSLDELPALWNVLKGEMSLVGPRPLLPEYLPLYSSFQARRHEVLPGVTGWAQINGRNSISWEDKFEMDVWYVDNHSIRLDIKILLLTVKKVFVREGISAADNVTITPFRGNNPGNQN
ncbi:MAG: sugar transferase [Aestuariibacter sp.]